MKSSNEDSFLWIQSLTGTSNVLNIKDEILLFKCLRQLTFESAKTQGITCTSLLLILLLKAKKTKNQLP